MRCECCNRALSNQESTSKFLSGEYTNMCNKCLSTIEEDVQTMDSDIDGEDIEEDYDDGSDDYRFNEKG